LTFTTSGDSFEAAGRRVPDAGAMNAELRTLILDAESRSPTVGRSNVGGWHSRADFFTRPETSVEALTTWATWTVKQMVEASAGAGRYTGGLSLGAWATVCRAGAYHAPHSHPESAWSGVYYVDAGTPDPDRPLSGVLEFLDPRAGAEAVTAPGDPYGEPHRVRPDDGLLVVFPSWLFHWVHPYTGRTPRIAVLFNATVEAPAVTPGRASAREPIETSQAP